MAKLRIGFGLAAAAGLLLGAPAWGQTISPGMTTAEVRGVLGAPSTTRTAGEWQYLYYQNGCPVRCGSDDVVFVQNGRVVAAVFRTGRRRFAGPRADDALAATDTGTPSTGEYLQMPRDARDMPVDEARQMPVEGARDEPGRTITGRPAREPARVGGVRVNDSNRSGSGSTTIRSGGSEGGTTTIIRRGESNGAGTSRDGSDNARSGSDDARVGGSRAGSTNARSGDARQDDRNQITGTGVDSPEDDVARVDSAQGAPATAVDDQRRARENRVEPNTIRTRAPAAADTAAEGRRRARERNVQPRVIPRP
ncbi:MAG TPA: outer membrane protein assembly factor BamE [Longimicrobium sp.]|nr:outer membrane protein assembly factor BamE [Longimicrobium sp.]